MEFDELQKIWDSQAQEPLWVINENALHKRILTKKVQASHIASFSEVLLLAVYVGVSIFIVALTYNKPKPNVFMYLLAAWMFGTALYVLISRVQRIKSSHTFDRSMLGELNHAISMATYQVRLSQLMRWNIMPIAALSLLGVWEVGRSVWIILGIVVFFALSYFAGGWEHRIYVGKKRELDALLKKLENE